MRLITLPSALLPRTTIRFPRLSRWLIVTAVCLPCLTTFGTPPPRNGVTPTVPPPPFVPTGGFRREGIANTYRNLAGIAAAPPPGDAATRGTRSLPVILVYFKDDVDKFPFPADFIRDQLFGKPGATDLQMTMTQYYKDVSNGNWQLSGKVFGPYLMAHDAAFYKDTNTMAFGELLDEALGAADKDAAMDWAEFDNDASTANGSDGQVDTVLIVHSRRGAESADPKNAADVAHQSVWSHSSQYERAEIGHDKGPFVTKSFRRSLGNPTPQHIVVQAYTIQPALGRQPNGVPTEEDFPGIGVFCHEYGHALGLPDLYDRTASPQADPAGPADSRGVGDWCLMSYGAYGASMNNPTIPLPLSAWGKEFRGWARVERITATRTVTFEPVERRNRVYRIDVPGAGGLEYFLLEWRDPKWGPSAGEPKKINWDCELAVAGLAVWHVDQGVGRLLPKSQEPNPYWPFTDPTPGVEGQNDEPSSFNGNTHSLLALLQRDGKMSFEHNDFAAPDAVLFGKGDVVRGDVADMPCSRSYKSAKTGIEIRDVDLTARTALVVIPPTAILPAAPPAATLPAHPATATTATSQPSAALARAARRINDGQVLTDADQMLLRRMRPADVHRQFDPLMAQKLNAAAADARTTSYPPSSQPSNPHDELLAQFVRESKTTAKIQRDPLTGHVLQIRNLRIARAGAASVDADARQRINGGLKPIIGNDVMLREAAPTTRPVGSSADVVSFQQFVKVGDKQLPVFGSGVNLYYESGNNLSTVGIHLKLDPTAALPATQAFDAERARAIVTSALKLPKEAGKSLEECREVVLPDAAGTGEAKAVWQVCVPIGKNQEPIHVFIDPASSKIVEIR